MDINMPFKNGLEAKKEICELFDSFNDKSELEGTLANRV